MNLPVTGRLQLPDIHGVQVERKRRKSSADTTPHKSYVVVEPLMFQEPYVSAFHTLLQ